LIDEKSIDNSFNFIGFKVKNKQQPWIDIIFCCLAFECFLMKKNTSEILKRDSDYRKIQ
jgi:hypothetical protein